MLDTWFSSALWPFATLGWPDDTEDLRAFYPGDLNTTARDIIRLWENRMIFCGLELMGDVPFRNVVIHSLVHAPTGGRMSKSLGTGMNPLALIDRYGADATRYGLMKMASSQDVSFSEGAIEEGRKLANKLWNVSRLLLSAAGDEVAERPASLEERWILARLAQVQRRIEGHLEEFDFSHLVGELYHLTFDDFCDWYAEAIKPRLYGGDEGARATALAALERLLKPAAPRDAARDRGDLDEPAGARDAPDRRALARGRRRERGRRARSACRRRRSGSGGAACSFRSRARRSGSSTRSSGPSGRR